MNKDVLQDEIDTLNAELRASDDPAAQKRIKEMIDERTQIYDRIYLNECKFDALEAEIILIEDEMKRTGNESKQWRIKELMKERIRIGAEINEIRKEYEE